LLPGYYAKTPVFFTCWWIIDRVGVEKVHSVLERIILPNGILPPLEPFPHAIRESLSQNCGTYKL
jgi:hypothetical protein